LARAATERTPRRRRSPEEAEREILDAAEELLREGGGHGLTVAAIMERTTLSRKSFYVYFRDRHDLITRLVSPLRAELDELTRASVESGNSPTSRELLLAIARTYMEHGELFLALQQAAREDPEAAEAWRAFVEPPIAQIAEGMRADGAFGVITPLRDPEMAARALVGMNLHAFFTHLIGNRDADLERVVDTLFELWQRALYLREPDT
jgi:AcrR family transcriptional regulator